MGEIKFKGTFDNAEVVNGFDEIVDATKATTKVVQSEAKKQTKAFNDESKKVKPIAQPVSADKINLVRQIKKEIRELESAAIKAGEGTREFAEAIELAGKKKAELKDLKDAISSLDPDTKATAFTNLASTGVQAGQAIAGAFALAGFEGEQYQKLLVRLQGIDAIGNGIRALGNLSDEWGKARNALLSYISKLEGKIVAEKVSAAIVAEGAAEQAVASEIAIASIAKEKAAVVEATIIQRLWNIAKSSGAAGVGILIAVLSIAAAAIYAYVSSTERAVAAEKERSKASDGTILKNKEVRESYNALLVAQNEYVVAVKVARGLLTEDQGATKNDEFERLAAITAAQNEYNASLLEEGLTREQNNAVIEQARVGLKHTGTQDAIDRQQKLNDAIAKADNEFKTKQLQRQKDHDVQMIEEQNKLAKEQIDNDLNTSLERLKTQKAILELGGQQSYEIQRKIVRQEQVIADMKAKDSKDSAEIMAANAEKAAQAMLAIDKSEADARRAFRQQLNNLIISQMDEGHQKELTLLEENYRAQNETRQEFFNRENGSLKAKYDKDLATINESLRTQREAILNDTALSGGQKAALIKELDESINKQRLDLEIRFQDDKTKIEKEYDRKRFEESQKNLDAIAKQKQDNIQFSVDMIDAQGEIENAHLKEQLNKKIISQAEYDKAILANELAAIKRRKDAVIAQDKLEFDRLQEKLRTEQAAHIDNDETVKQLDAAKKKLALDGIKFDAEIADKSVDIDADALEEKKKLQEIAKQDFELIKQAADKILEQQQSDLDRMKELNDAAISENDRYLGVLTEQLKAEQEARAEGFASNVGLVEDEIAAEKEARRQNLEDQKAIQAEQARLNKIKLIEDKAQQASALITAAANIIKGWSELPIVGQVLGIAAIGAMLASFVAFSSKAKSIPGFAKGTKKAPPGLKWVGEEGPELINDKGGYRIFTNKESNSIVNNYKTFSSKIPQYDFTSHISRALQPKISTDTKGIERRLDKGNSLLEKGLNETKTTYSGNKKITQSGGTTIVTKELNARR